MKYRLVDLLRSVSDESLLRIGKVHKCVTVPSAGPMVEVRCKQFCAFKDRRIEDANVSAKDCTQCYSQEITEGELISETGERYPIRDGIPRLLSKSSAEFLRRNQKSFSLEWKYSRQGERNWGQDIEFRKSLFLKGFGMDAGALQGRLMLDAGCGSGAISIAVGDAYGLEVVGIDLATGVEEAYKRNTNPNVHFIQGSVLELPFRDGAFDLLYCAGVLIHLPNTKEAFELLPRVLRTGGRCFIWVYHIIEMHTLRADRFRERVYRWVRLNITSRLAIEVQEAIYLCLLAPFAIKRTLWNLFKKEKETRNWREKMQNFIDTFSPMYVNRHTHEQVLSWFREAGFKNSEVAYSERYGFGVRGDLQVVTVKKNVSVGQV